MPKIKTRPDTLQESHARLLQCVKELLFNSMHGNGLAAHHKAWDNAHAAIDAAEYVARHE
jgi:hypothetical protein